MASFRTETEIQADLTVWRNARTQAASGRSFTIVTSAGTRVLTTQSMSEINATISALERELLACQQANQNKQGLHNFALANMGDNGANR